MFPSTSIITFSTRITIFFSRRFTWLRVQIPQLRTCSPPSCPCSNSVSSFHLLFLAKARKQYARTLHNQKAYTNSPVLHSLRPIHFRPELRYEKKKQKRCITIYSSHTQDTTLMSSESTFIEVRVTPDTRKEESSQRPLYLSRLRYFSTQYATQSVAAKPCRNLSREKKRGVREKCKVLYFRNL